METQFHNAFASRLVMRGVDLRTVQELMGHKTFNMTLRNAHLAPSHLKSAVDRLPSGAPAASRRGLRIVRRRA